MFKLVRLVKPVRVMAGSRRNKYFAHVYVLV